MNEGGARLRQPRHRRAGDAGTVTVTRPATRTRPYRTGRQAAGAAGGPGPPGNPQESSL